MTQKEILEIQAPSTRMALERPVELDLEWFNRKLPKEAQVLKEDGSIDLNVRSFSKTELAVEESIREKRGGWISQYFQTEDNAQTLTEEKKNTAIESFMKTRTVDWIKDKFKSLMADVKKMDVWK